MRCDAGNQEFRRTAQDEADVVSGMEGDERKQNSAVMSQTEKEMQGRDGRLAVGVRRE